MGDRRAVIIGGGITGALTARDLAEAGWQVVMLEGAHIGAGSSSRTAAGAACGTRRASTTSTSPPGLRRAASATRTSGW